MKSPTFSVIIPTYNHAELLKAAVESVLNQTYRDFEVIVVNNYSSDHTEQVVHQLEDSRVKLINFRNHGIIGAGRNVGIKASGGKYVAFLDSDDTWYSNKLERIAEAIDADPEIGLFCHDQALVGDDRPPERTYFGPPRGYQGTMHEFVFLISNGPSTSATVVARRYLDEVDYFSEDPTLAFAEDHDLWLKLSKVCRFQFIPEVLGTHLFHTANSSSNVETHLPAALAVLDKHCRELQRSDRIYPKRAIRRRYGKDFYDAARVYQLDGAILKSLHYFARTLWNYPFYAKAYGGLALLAADMVLGRARRRKVVGVLLGNRWQWK